MTRKDVLVVDDEPLMRDALELSLRSEFRVAKARSGMEALEIAEDRTFPVVVLDLRMDGLDGIATLKRLRRRDAFQKIVILTAHQSMESAIEAVNSGAYGYLTKPCNFSQLRSVLSEAHHRYFEEQERLEACRERLLAMHDDFFSVLCHEFNTPLNGIIGFSSALKEELEDEDKARLAGFIEDTATDLHRVFLEILDYINSKAPAQRPPHAPFTGPDIAGWLHEKRRSSGIDYTLVGDFWSDARELKGPFHPICAILSKVIEAGQNAESGPARIFGKREAGQVVFTLGHLDLESRYGSPDNLESLFSPYATPSSVRRRFDTGIGLNLPTCRNIADTVGIALSADRGADDRIEIQVTAEVSEAPESQ